MQSIRRAALRSVASAARASATKAPSNQFASQFVAKNIVKPAALPLARYFSQTVRMLNENEDGNVENINNDVESQLTEKTHEQETPKNENPPHGIWVRNFVFDVNEDHLKELFSKFGSVVKATVVRDPRGLSRGFGFVYMDNDAAVESAVAELNGSFWHGRRVHMEKQTGERKRREQPRERKPDMPTEPTRFLYIGNIPYEATDAELNKMFRGLDNLEDVRVAVDRITGFPRGFAHADFTSVEAAKVALEKLADVELGGRQLRVDYAGSAVKDDAQRRQKRTFTDRRGHNRESFHQGGEGGKQW